MLVYQRVIYGDTSWNRIRLDGGWDQHDIFFRVDRWGAALFLFNFLMTIMTNWLLDVINWTIYDNVFKISQGQ